MYTIKKGILRSKIEPAVPQPYGGRLLKHMTKKAANAFWMAKAKPGWSGETAFLSAKTWSFPSGLIGQVVEWFEETGLDYTIEDETEYPFDESLIHKDMLKGIELRDYQIESIKVALTFGRGLLGVATGGGKTEIIVGICKVLNVKTLIMVERKNLVTQTRKRFIERGFSSKDLGVYSGDTKQNDKLITIATTQSLKNIAKELPEWGVKCIIADEVHHAKARTYLKVLRKLNGAKWRFGVSGTVFSDDELDNWYRMSYLGQKLYDMSTATLVQQNILSKPIIKLIEINRPRDPNLAALRDYHEAYKQGVAYNAYRNKIIVGLARSVAGKTLVLFRLKDDHGKVLSEMLPEAIYLDGDTPSEARDILREEFNKSKKGIMLASTIFDEGIDLPGINNLIIASGGKSVIKVIQRLGRGLRKNKQMQVHVFDFMDNTNNYLTKHSWERVNIYKEEQHDVKLTKVNVKRLENVLGEKLE